MSLIQSREYDWGSENPFKDALLPRWGISFDAYQVLEVILRQALIEPTGPGYTYAFEKREPRLTIESVGGIPSFVKSVQAHLAAHEIAKKDRFLAVIALHRVCPREDSWGSYLPKYRDLEAKVGVSGDHAPATLERRIGENNRYTLPTTMLEYGLEKSAFRKGLDDALTLTALRLDENRKPASEVTKGRRLRAMIQERLGISGRAVGKYVPVSDQLSTLTMKTEHHEFFRNYFSAAWAVYYPFFVRSKEVRGHRFYQFLSEKVIYTFGNDAVLRDWLRTNVEEVFTPDALSERLKNNLKNAQLLQDRLTSLGLISGPFFDYLEENHGSLNRA